MIIIGVYGGTGSGKTKIVKEITSKFPSSKIQVISQDSYYKDNSNITFKKRCLLNYDHPYAIDFDLLYKNIKKLKDGGEIKQPIYDFKIHNRTTKTILIKPKKILIVEGILIMNNEKLRNLFDFKVFIDANSEIRMERRIKRDISERGRTREEIMSRFKSTLKPMHDKYIKPNIKLADLIIENHDNSSVNVNQIILKLNEK
ncbi:MAG: uridine kinase [Flavobacteriaceae bacterium]|nr:uridine kinase [Flavobacteriaceae bacterium]|tara:strand:+ start:3804 stop:4406 length:603 start_codon:yes stop_codon:yes gene_type:complete